MKNTKSIAGMLAGLIISAMSAYAQEGAGTPPQAPWEKLAKLGSGVHEIKKDGNRLQSCVIVGEARISTVLGSSKGLSIASRNAQLNAEGAFVSWLKTNVSSVRSFGDETTFELQGSGDGEATETGQSVESSAAQITSAAQGAIRGMTLLGEHRDAEGKMLYRIYGWKPGYAELAADAEQAMEPVVESGPSAPQGGQYVPSAPSGKTPGFESRTLISPEAAEFL